MLRLLESFDFYGISGRTGTTLDTDIKRRHDGGSILSGTDGDLIIGRGADALALQFNYDSNNKVYVTRFDPNQSDTWIMGFAFKTGDECRNANRKIWECLTAQLVLMWSKGSLQIDSNDWARPEQVNYAMKSNRWYYIEIKVYFHNSAGTVEIRVNGIAVYTTSSKDTLSGSYGTGDVFVLYAPENNCAFDDFYLCDDTGSDNNDFLGPIKVETLRPTSDDGTQNWTPSTGVDHYALVDDANMWDPAEYVQASGANIDDLWGYENLSKITGTIHAVQLITSVWTDTGVPRTLQGICKSGGTPYYGTAKGVGATTEALPYEAIWETDPDTASAWTSANVDAASFGIRKV